MPELFPFYFIGLLIEYQYIYTKVRGCLFKNKIRFMILRLRTFPAGMNYKKNVLYLPVNFGR